MKREDDDGNSGTRSQASTRHDEVKRGRPPREPRDDRRPSSDPPPGWREKLKAGDPAEIKRLIQAFADEPSSEKLEELVERVRETVNAAPQPTQVSIGVGLAAARKKWAAKPNDAPPPPEHVVFDRLGETDGELFSNPMRWASRMIEEWHRTPAFEQSNLLHHNADGLVWARSAAGAAELLADVHEQTPSAEEASPFDDAVAMADPPKDEDEVWVDARVSEIQAIANTPDGRKTFDALVAETRPRIGQLRTTKQELFKWINGEFTRKHRALPGAAA